MEAVRFELVREIFGGAVERPADEWTAYLEHACGGDRELHAEVRSLLEEHRGAGDFLERPPLSEVAAAGAEATVASDDLAPGTRVGAYEILGPLGRGGMGTVYAATRADGAFSKRVAIKLVDRGPGSGELARRFAVEREILASLDHPAIARLLDAGTTAAGRPYLVMEEVDGVPIDEHCDARKLGVGARLELFGRVCAAVESAHRRLVVHRDLKPSNILVTAAGEPKLLDFGIAKLLAPDRAGQDPATLLRPLTPGYASPEQLGGAPITTASDVYSLGVLLYLLLAGRLPFASSSPAAWVEAVRGGEPQPPSAVAVSRRLRRRLAGDLDAIVLKALRQEPENRYGSAAELAHDLRRHLEGRPVTARRDGRAYRWGKFLRRHRLGALAVAGFCAASLGFAIVMARERAETTRQRDLAEAARAVAVAERQRAEEVTTFLVNLFQASDPYGADVGRDPGARELLERGAHRFGSEIDLDPATRAGLGQAIGAIYRRLGGLEEAAPLLTEALELRRGLPGGAPKKVAETLDELGLVHQEGGDFGAAEAAFREALALRRSAPAAGGEDRAVLIAVSLSRLAALAQKRGEFVRAEELYRQALALWRSSSAGHEMEIAETLGRLAANLHDQGEPEKAAPLYREALALQQRLSGDGHPHVGHLHMGLARLHLERGDDEPAERHYRAALAVFRRAFGDRHPYVAHGYQSLGAIHAGRGELEESERHYRQALELLIESRGEDHLEVASAHNALGGLLRIRGDPVGAERHYRRALAIRETLGEENPYVATSLTGLARTLAESGDCAAAEPLYRRAIAIGRRHFPGGHRRISRAETLLAECRLAAGDLGEAEALLLSSRAYLNAHAEAWPRELESVLAGLAAVEEARLSARRGDRG